MPTSKREAVFFYNEDDKPYSIRLLFTPDENGDEDSKLSSSGWCAEMFVRCDSVPQLTREGLRWSSENIRREEGHFSFGPIPYPWGPSRGTSPPWAPHEAYNALYDDMPMEGWWPWPKTQPEDVPAAKASPPAESSSSSSSSSSSNSRRPRSSSDELPWESFNPADSTYIHIIYAGVNTVNPELEGQRGGY
ncbi:hypothetical protein PG996_012246 [Apiospora saccharicola]|uniref:Uncharacterized protein n=1 Tax=Apiospora saccharicola TaxID=335842 RepID=A0ABR1U216_9PEZI